MHASVLALMLVLAPPPDAPPRAGTPPDAHSEAGTPPDSASTVHSEAGTPLHSASTAQSDGGAAPAPSVASSEHGTPSTSPPAPGEPGTPSTPAPAPSEPSAPPASPDAPSEAGTPSEPASSGAGAAPNDSAVPPAAAAADGLRILVVPPPAPNGDAQRSFARAEEIYAGLRAAGLQPVELDEREGVDRPADVEPVGERDVARAKLQDAKARFRELDLEGVRAASDATIAEVLRLERPEDAIELVADALLLKAATALQSGADDEARRDLILLTRLEPGRTALHPGLYAPSLVDAYAAARAADESAPASSALVVRPRVAGFAQPEILVDARPWTGEPLKAGAHVVTVRAAAPKTTRATGTRSGAMSWSRLVNIGNDPLVVEPFLEPSGAATERARLVDASRRAKDDAARAPLLLALAELSAAKAVVYVDATHASLVVAGRSPETLPVPPTANGATLGRATLAALQAPARIEDLPLAPEVLVGASAVGIVMIGTAIAVGLWALLPPAPIEKPPTLIRVRGIQ